MPTLLPPAGSIGLPEGVKEAGRRVDFRPDEFTLAIETKGYRIAWSRAAFCPCVPNNDQTEQPDPNCPLCKGSGWVLFKPAGAVSNKDITGSLDEIHEAIVGTDSAVVRGIISGITNKREPYDQILSRLEGMCQVTVRAENKLGYYDRIVNLDSTVVFAQVLDFEGSTSMRLRYPVRAMNRLQSSTKVYTEGGDFNLVAGRVEWISGNEPATGTRLAAHYLTHPTWRVVEHPHAARLTPVKFKTTSKTGDETPLPVQAVVRLEYLPDSRY